MCSRITENKAKQIYHLVYEYYSGVSCALLDQLSLELSEYKFAMRFVSLTFNLIFQGDLKHKNARSSEDLLYKLSELTMAS